MTLDDPRNMVEVLEYNPKWRESFLSKKELLESVIGDLTLSLEHVGRTCCSEPQGSEMTVQGYVGQGAYGKTTEIGVLKEALNWIRDPLNGNPSQTFFSWSLSPPIPWSAP